MAGLTVVVVVIVAVPFLWANQIGILHAVSIFSLSLSLASGCQPCFLVIQKK
jgi:hypothetical protein